MHFLRSFGFWFFKTDEAIEAIEAIEAFKTTKAITSTETFKTIEAFKWLVFVNVVGMAQSVSFHHQTKIAWVLTTGETRFFCI